MLVVVKCSMAIPELCCLDRLTLAVFSQLGLNTTSSAAAGSRSKVYSIMFSAGLAGSSIGPCAAAATFAVTGNKWHLQTLQHVILVGMVLSIVPILALLCLDDDQSLGQESDAVRHHPTSQGPPPHLLSPTG